MLSTLKAIFLPATALSLPGLDGAKGGSARDGAMDFAALIDAGLTVTAAPADETGTDAPTPDILTPDIMTPDRATTAQFLAAAHPPAMPAPAAAQPSAEAVAAADAIAGQPTPEGLPVLPALVAVATDLETVLAGPAPGKTLSPALPVDAAPLAGPETAAAKPAPDNGLVAAPPVDAGDETSVSASLADQPATASASLQNDPLALPIPQAAIANPAVPVVDPATPLPAAKPRSEAKSDPTAPENAHPNHAHAPIADDEHAQTDASDQDKDIPADAMQAVAASTPLPEAIVMAAPVMAPAPQPVTASSAPGAPTISASIAPDPLGPVRTTGRPGDARPSPSSLPDTLVAAPTAAPAQPGAQAVAPPSMPIAKAAGAQTIDADAGARSMDRPDHPRAPVDAGQASQTASVPDSKASRHPLDLAPAGPADARAPSSLLLAAAPAVAQAAQTSADGAPVGQPAADAPKVDAPEVKAQRTDAISLLQLVRDHMTGRTSARTGVDSTIAQAAPARARRVAEAALPVAVPTADSAPPQATASAQPVIALPPQPLALAPLADLSASLGTQVVDMGVSGQWIDGLARDIAGLSANGAQGNFHVNAGQLGPVQVDIRQGADGASVSLTVATEAAEQALRQDSDRLRLDAGLSAVRIAEVKIDRAPHVVEPARTDSSNQQSSSQQPSSTGWQAGQGMSQSGGQSAGQSQGRWQARENLGGGAKAGGDAAVLNHDPRDSGTGASTRDGGRARYA